MKGRIAGGFAFYCHGTSSAFADRGQLLAIDFSGVTSTRPASSWLTPAERQHLDEMVTAYQKGLLAEAQHAAEEALKAKQAARRSAEEALKAKQVAEADAKAAKRQRLNPRGAARASSAKAKVLLVPGTKIEYAVIKSTIAGKFEGWDGHTIFNLANGQRWQVFKQRRSLFHAGPRTTSRWKSGLLPWEASWMFFRL